MQHSVANWENTNLICYYANIRSEAVGALILKLENKKHRGEPHNKMMQLNLQ